MTTSYEDDKMRRLTTRQEGGWTDARYRIKIVIVGTVIALLANTVSGNAFVMFIVIGIVFLLVMPIRSIGSLRQIQGEDDTVSKNKYLYGIIADYFRARRYKKRFGRIYTTKLSQIGYDGESGLIYQPKCEVPVQINAIPIQDGQGGVLGEIYSQDTGRHAMVTFIDGDNSTSTAGTTQAYIRNDKLVEATKLLYETYGSAIGITYFLDRRPANPYPIISHQLRNKRQDINPDSPLALNLEHATDLAFDNGACDITSGIVVSSLRPRSWSKISLDKLPLKEFKNSAAFMATDILAKELSANGFENVRRANLYELFGLCRTRFDTTHANDFYADMEIDQQDQAGDDVDPQVIQQGPFPEDWRVGSRYLRVGGDSWHCCLRARFSLEQVPDGFYRELFGLVDGWYTIALTTEVATNKSEKFKRRQHSAYVESKSREKLARGGVLTPQEQDQDRLIHEQEASLYYSKASPVRASLIIMVSASSLEQLQNDVARMKSAARGLQLPLSIIDGEHLQVPAALQTLGVVVD